MHCIPLTPGFFWLCKLQGERTFLFPAVALPWKMYTKHSLPCDASCPAVSTSDFYLTPYQQHLCFVATLPVIVPVINVPRVRKDALQIHSAKAQGPVSLSFRCYPFLQMISLPKRLLCLKKSCQCPLLLSHCNYSISVHPPCPLLGITRHFLHPEAPSLLSLCLAELPPSLSSAGFILNNRQCTSVQSRL